MRFILMMTGKKADWDAFLKTHTQFVREWDKVTGLR